MTTDSLKCEINSAASQKASSDDLPWSSHSDQNEAKQKMPQDQSQNDIMQDEAEDFVDPPQFG